MKVNLSLLVNSVGITSRCTGTHQYAWLSRIGYLRPVSLVIVLVTNALTRDAVFDGARAIARISGCEINTATELMHHLPGVLPPLYKHQAQRLVRELSKIQTLAHLRPFP